MLKAVIIDDEADARALLRTMLAELCPAVQFAGEAEGVQSGLRLLRRQEADILFLDIQMEDGTGFDLLDCFPDPAFQVIFTTAHDHYALRAFRYYAVDYLLKPISPRDLIQATERLKSSPVTTRMQQIQALKRDFRKQQFDTLAISTTDGISFLNLVDILHIESDGNYTTFVMENGERVMASKGMSQFEGLFPEGVFYRIHQSHIVQLRFVRKILKKDGHFALMSNGDTLPIARRRKDDFVAMLMGGTKL